MHPENHTRQNNIIQTQTTQTLQHKTNTQHKHEHTTTIHTNKPARNNNNGGTQHAPRTITHNVYTAIQPKHTDLTPKQSNKQTDKRTKIRTHEKTNNEANQQ